LVMIGTDGNEVDRLVGYRAPEPFLKTFRDYAAGIGTLADLENKAKTDTSLGLMFEIADKYKYRGEMDAARPWYDKVIDAGAPTDSMAGEARMAKADILRRDKNYDEAIREYEMIAKDFDGKIMGWDSQIWIAYIQVDKGDSAAGLQSFKDFITNNPKAPEGGVAYCQRRITELETAMAAEVEGAVGDAKLKVDEAAKKATGGN